MNTPKDQPSLKSQFSNASNDQEGAQKQTKLSGYEQPENEARKLQLNDNQNTICSDTWISFRELEDFPWQPSNSEECEQLSLLKSTPTLNSSCDRTSQEYQFILISETISLIVESLTLLPADSPALALVTQELEQVLSIPPRLCGKKVYELSRRRNPNSWWLNNQQEFSHEDYELFLEDSEWQDIKAKLKLSRHRSLEQVIKDKEFLSFPTLTSNSSGKTRPAGQTKCEKWFKSKGLVPNGSQLGSEAIAMIMGFPPNWFNSLSPIDEQAESEVDTSQEEQLHQRKHQSPSVESSISIPCIVKQPKQPEVKGIIQKDEGDRFVVEVDGKEISISKLFVYPDFSETVGQIPPSEKVTPPSKSPPTKQRRKKGDGTGYISLFCHFPRFKSSRN